MSFESRVETRRKNFKKGVDGDDARRKREDEALSLRKAKKDEQLQKKRMMFDPTPDGDENAPSNANAPAGKASTPQLGELNARLQAPALGAEERLAIVTDIRKRLSKACDPPTQEACDAGLVPLMVAFLAGEDTKLQFEAAWVLTNIASGESHQTAAVVHAGAVPQFVQLLGSPLMETREQAVWALGNILGDSAALRDHCLQHALIPAMLQLIVEAEQSGKVSALRNATWAVSNALRGKPGPDLIMVAPAVPYIAQLMHHADQEVLTDTLWAISYLCDGDSPKIDAFLQTGGLAHVVAHLGHADFKVVQPALRAVGNVATGTDAHTQAVVQAGALAHVEAMLARTRTCIRKEAMWLLSNVTAGNQAQIQAALDAGLMPKVVACAQNDVTDVRKEAFWVVANAAVGGTPAQLEALADAGAVGLCASALAKTQDHATLVALLDGLKAFLAAGRAQEQDGFANRFTGLVEEAEGLTNLESLQEDENVEVYSKALEIIETFFEAADEAEPADATGAFDFA